MPNAIGGSRSPSPSVYNDNPQQPSGASPSRTPHQSTAQASDPLSAADNRRRALRGRENALAWLRNTTDTEPVLRMPGEAAISSTNRLSPEVGNISYPAHTQAQLNELIEQGEIQPNLEDHEAAERGIEHTRQHFLPEVPVEQLMGRLRNEFPLASESSLRTLAEMEHNQREDMFATEVDETRHAAYMDIATQRLDNLGIQLVGTDLSKENEYVQNCQELQQALRDESLAGRINEKTHQAYSDRLSNMIEEMPNLIHETIQRHANLAQRLNELISLGDIRPSAEEFAEAERNIARYLASQDYAEAEPEEREEDISNFRNAPYLGIAHDRLDGLSNPPVGADFVEQHEYVQGCNDLKRALHQKFDEGAINEKTYQAYVDALDIKTEDIVLTIDMQRQGRGW